MHEVDVKMKNVELLFARADVGQHRKVSGDVGLEWRRVESERLIASRYQSSLRAGIGAREQRDLVAQIDQSIRQMGHYAFGAAVQMRRYRFVERRDMRNA